MFANKTRIYRIFTLSFFTFAIANTSITSLYGMSLGNSILKKMCSLPILINSYTYGSQMFSKTAQDEVFASQKKNDLVSDSVLKLINEVIEEMKTAKECSQDLEIDVKKMRKEHGTGQEDVPYRVAEEYKFIGIAPTNKTLYIDEDYFKENTETQEAQKYIIRTALKHYLNSTYSKALGSRFITSSFALAGASYISNYALEKMSSMAHNYISSPDNSNIAWYNPVEAGKNFGILSAKFLIGGFIFQQVYKRTLGTLEKNTTQRYLAYKENQFAKEAENKLESEPIELNLSKHQKSFNLAKGFLNLVSRNKKYEVQDNILNNRITAMFENTTINTANNDVDQTVLNLANKLLPKVNQFSSLLKTNSNANQIGQLRNEINNQVNKQPIGIQRRIDQSMIETIMESLNKEFELLKQTKKIDDIQTFMFVIPSRIQYYPERIQHSLHVYINQFIEREVIPFNNSLVTN